MAKTGPESTQPISAPPLGMQVVSSGDIVLLFSHEHDGVVECDGFFGGEPVLVRTSEDVPHNGCLDERCFIVHHAAASALGTADSAAIHPRELVTLEHVASGLLLAGDEYGVALQPAGGGGLAVAWEIGRVLAALGNAPVQVGELLHMRTSEGGFHLVVDASNPALPISCKPTPGCWQLVRYAPASLPSELRFGDWVRLVLPGYAAGYIGARTTTDESETHLVCMRHSAASSTLLSVPHSGAVWQVLHTDETEPSAEPLQSSRSQFVLRHALTGTTLRAPEVALAPVGHSGARFTPRLAPPSPAVVASLAAGCTAANTAYPRRRSSAMAVPSAVLTAHLTTVGTDGGTDSGANGGGFRIADSLGDLAFTADLSAGLPSSAAAAQGLRLGSAPLEGAGASQGAGAPQGVDTPHSLPLRDTRPLECAPLRSSSFVALRVHVPSASPIWVAMRAALAEPPLAAASGSTGRDPWHGGGSGCGARPVGLSSIDDQICTDEIALSEVSFAAPPTPCARAAAGAAAEEHPVPLVVAMCRVPPLEAREMRYVIAARRHIAAHAATWATMAPSAHAAAAESPATANIPTIAERTAVKLVEVLLSLSAFCINRRRQCLVHEAAVPTLLLQLLRVVCPDVHAVELVAPAQRTHIGVPLRPAQRRVLAACYACLHNAAHGFASCASELCAQVPLFLRHLGFDIGAETLLESVFATSREVLAMVGNGHVECVVRMIVANALAGGERVVAFSLLASLCGRQEGAADTAGGADGFWLAEHQVAVARVLREFRDELLHELVWLGLAAAAPSVAAEAHLPLRGTAAVAEAFTPETVALQAAAGAHRSVEAVSAALLQPPEDTCALGSTSAVQSALTPRVTPTDARKPGKPSLDRAGGAVTPPLPSPPPSPRSAAAMVGGDGSSVGVRWDATHASNQPAAHELFGTDAPALRRIAALTAGGSTPLAKDTLRECLAAGMEGKGSGAGDEERNESAAVLSAARGALGRMLLAELTLLAALCEGWPEGSDESDARQLLPPLEILLACADDGALLPAFRGACVRLVLVAHADTPPWRRSPPLPAALDLQEISLKLGASTNPHPRQGQLFALLLSQLTATAAAAALAGFESQLPLMRPLLRLADFGMSAGIVHTASQLETLGPHLLRMLRACALRAVAHQSSSRGHGADRCANDDPAVTGAADAANAAGTAGGIATEVVVCARLLCRCVGSFVLLQRQLDIVAAALAMSSGRLVPASRELAEPHAPAQRLYTESDVRNTAALNAALARSRAAALPAHAHGQCAQLDAALDAASAVLQLPGAGRQPLVQLLLPLLAFKDYKLSTAVLHTLGNHLEQRRALLQLAPRVLLLSAPTSVALHAKLSVLVPLLTDAIAARPAATAGMAADAAAQVRWHGTIAPLLAELCATVQPLDAFREAAASATRAVAIATSPALAAVATNPAADVPAVLSDESAHAAARSGSPGHAVAQRALVLRAMRIDEPLCRLLDALPAAEALPAAGTAPLASEGASPPATDVSSPFELAQLALAALAALAATLAAATPIDAVAAKPSSMLSLLSRVQTVARHAACAEAVACLGAFLGLPEARGAVVKADLVRILLPLPLAHGARPELIRLVRALVRDGATGAVLEAPCRAVDSALRALPPQYVAQLLPIGALAVHSLSAEGLATRQRELHAITRAGGGGSPLAGFDVLAPGVAYEVEATKLLSDCAAGASFAGKALFRRLFPLAQLVSAVTTAESVDALRTPLFRLLLAAHVDTELRAADFAESAAVHALLEYVASRIHAAAGVATAAAAAAASTAASTSVAAVFGASELATAPAGSFLASAALPFLWSFFSGLYHPVGASVRLRAVALRLATSLAALVAALGAPRPIASVLQAHDATLLRETRRVGRRLLLLLLHRHGLQRSAASLLGAAVPSSPSATPRGGSGDGGGGGPSPLSPAHLLASFRLATSPRLSGLAFNPQSSPRGQLSGEGSNALVAGIAGVSPPLPSIQHSYKAGWAMLTAAAAVAAAEVAAAGATDRALETTAEHDVQRQWERLWGELRHSSDVADAACLAVDLDPTPTLDGRSFAWLVRLLVRHARHELHGLLHTERAECPPHRPDVRWPPVRYPSLALDGSGGAKRGGAPTTDNVGRAHSRTAEAAPHWAIGLLPLGLLGSSAGGAAGSCLAGVLQLLYSLLRHTPHPQRSASALVLVSSGSLSLVCELVAAHATLPAELMELGLRLGLALLGGAGKAAQEELGELLGADEAHRDAAQGLYDLMRALGRALGLASDGSGHAHMPPGPPATGAGGGPLHEVEAANLRRALLVLDFIVAACDGPHAGAQRALRRGGRTDAAVASGPTQPTTLVPAKAGTKSGWETLGDCFATPLVRVDALGETCRWLLRWEAYPRPVLLPLATRATLVIIAFCEGPHVANRTVVLSSAVPTCAARLLAMPYHPTLYSARGARRLRTALAALLGTCLRPLGAGAAWHAAELTRQGSALDARALRRLLIGAHAATCPSAAAPGTRAADVMANGVADASDVAEDDGDPAGAAPTTGERVASNPVLRRWVQPGVPLRVQECLAEGCELYALIEVLCELVERLRADILPMPVRPGRASLPLASNADYGGSAELHAAFRFFRSRAGRVLVCTTHGTYVTVSFAVPEDLLRLPLSIRRQLRALTNGASEHGTAAPRSCLNGSLNGSHREARRAIFLRQCVLVSRQMAYQRTLAYYMGFVALASRFEWLLLMLQAVIALLLNFAALAPYPAEESLKGTAATAIAAAGAGAVGVPRVPPPPDPLASGYARQLAAAVAATATRWPTPPLWLSGAHLAISLVLVALYVIRYGPTIITHNKSTTPVAALPSPLNPLGQRRGSGAAGTVHAPLAAYAPLTPLLLRLRASLLVWLPLLHACSEFIEALREVRAQMRAFALGDTDEPAVSVVDTPDAALDAKPGAPSSGLGQPLMPAVFVTLSARALLSDGTMFLLAAQLTLGTLSLRIAPHLIAVLPLLSAIACMPPLRRFASALCVAVPLLLVPLTATLLVANLFTAYSSHVLPIACGDSGGPWACTDGGPCLAVGLELLVHSQGLRDECVRAAALAADSPVRTKAASLAAAGADALPALQLSFSLAMPMLLLAWSCARICAAGAVKSDGWPPMSDFGVRSPWQQCAFICRFTSAPAAVRSNLEQRCAQSLADGTDIFVTCRQRHSADNRVDTDVICPGCAR